MVKDIRKIVPVKTAYGEHLCLFKPDKEGGFVITAINLPGVVTWGRNILHGKKMAKEAIELCIECEAEKKLSSMKRKSSVRSTEQLAV